MSFDFKINGDGTISPYSNSNLVLGFGTPNEVFYDNIGKHLCWDTSFNDPV